jgi:hypothetical protein
VSGVGNPSFPLLHVPVVAYRGVRPYVHSTTLYTELMAAAGAFGLALDGTIEMRFKQAITSTVEMHFDGEVESREANAAPIRFAVGNGDRTIFGRIIGTDKPVTDRKPYDESGIWDIAKINGRAVSLSGGRGYAPIEVVTSLCALLHNTIFKPPAGRRWLLARLSLRRPLRPTDAVEMKIAITHVIGQTMTRSNITASDGVIGTLDFMIGTAPPTPAGGA